MAAMRICTRSSSLAYDEGTIRRESVGAEIRSPGRARFGRGPSRGVCNGVRYAKSSSGGFKLVRKGGDAQRVCAGRCTLVPNVGFGQYLECRTTGTVGVHSEALITSVRAAVHSELLWSLRLSVFS